jgi:hypothetical protein
MYLKYGSYAHASGEASIAIAKEAIFSDSGIRTDIRETWTINGMMFATNSTALTSALLAMQAAYSKNGLDLGLYEDSGAATAHVLLATDCRGGTKVLSIGYPKGTGYQYGTYRDYQIVVEGLKVSYNGLLSFNETISFSGGGPEFVYQECLTGLPQKQILKQATTFKARQMGEAVGTDAYPAFPAPLWPSAEHRNQRVTDLLPPRRMGQYGAAKHTEYRIVWAYTFESASRLVGLPGKLS